ncbi:RNA polymerase sigma factor [Celeribacter sp.]|uniref:RNA polymerase sigma factor n=1 Tax=Celeribacter sp. TaxID=1890673 RepID=UPI003A8F4A56
MTDAQLRALLTRIVAKDKIAFKQVYEALERPLFRFIHLKLNDPFQASDILHDVFMEVWNKADRYQGRSTVKSWVFGIAHNKTMDVFRKSSRLVVTDTFPDVEDEGPTGESCVLAAQEAAHVKACLGTLKPQQKEVIELAFYEDMSYRDIGTVLNIPEGTIKTRIFHAKQLLLRCLTDRIQGKGSRHD